MKSIVEGGYFDFFQSEQSSKVKPFHKCDVIVSFIGLENNLCEFYGIYKVDGFREFTNKDVKISPKLLNIDSTTTRKGYERIWYKLVEIKQFTELRSRLIVQWKSTRGWFQTKDLEIYEILPPSKVIQFPGYQDVFISYENLVQVFSNPRAHKDWKAALEANAGIYRIVDMSTGQIYIGSAYGSEGLWGRWKTYAKNGHGGNKLLKGLDPNNFYWSIIRTLSRTMSERDVIKIEGVEKIKHGSRVYGLNNN